MFKPFYGLTFNPFDKSLPESHAFESRDFKQMLSRLDYLKNTRGIGLFTAPPGMGKTFALRCFAKNLNPNLFQISYICLSTVSVSEFYHQFSLALGLDYSSKKTVMFRNIQERLFHLLKEKRKTFILAIDESQYLNAGIFRDIKMLMNVHFDSLDCFALIFIGKHYIIYIIEISVNCLIFSKFSLRFEIFITYLYSSNPPFLVF